MAIITLLGYMGSGKSTYGKLLANKLNYNFIDLDEYIEYKEGKTIKNIFSEFGEDYFRTRESEYLKELLLSSKDTVLSLGGGTPTIKANMMHVNEYSESVYLNASVNTLFTYLKHAKSKRPIIKDLDDQELEKFINKHLGSRLEYYKKAKHNIITDDKSIENIVNELYTLLKVL